MTTLNARANQAWRKMCEAEGWDPNPFYNQGEAYEHGWEAGYKARTADVLSSSVQDRIAQACGDPGSIVGRQFHIDESLSRWQMRAVLHILAEAVS